MATRIGIGLLGLGTVGGGVAEILQTPDGRHPLVADLDLVRVAVRDLNRPRPVELPADCLTTNPEAVVDDPNVHVVVEVMGGIEPARTLIMRAIAAGKSVVTANKAVIARHGEEIAAAAASAGVYVLIEAAVGGGIPIIEPLKQSLGGNRIQRVSGIINGTTNYILSRMAQEGADYNAVLRDAQELGYAEADPAADVDGLDAADKIAILAGLAFGGPIPRAGIPTDGISSLQSRDVDYATQLDYGVKLLAVAERADNTDADNADRDGGPSLPLAVRVQPTLVPLDHPLAGVHGVNNAILVEGDPIGRVMFYGPGAGAGPTASAGWAHPRQPWLCPGGQRAAAAGDAAEWLRPGSRGTAFCGPGSVAGCLRPRERSAPSLSVATDVRRLPGRPGIRTAAGDRRRNRDNPTALAISGAARQ